MFAIELYGQTYHFYEVQEFAKVIGVSRRTLERETEHPARIKDRGRVLWCPELYALHMLPETVISKKVAPQTGRRLTKADFEPHLKIADGGNRGARKK